MQLCLGYQKLFFDCNLDGALFLKYRWRFTPFLPFFALFSAFFFFFFQKMKIVKNWLGFDPGNKNRG
jgi:hypothetical protein